jgi:CBS domain-containing protein
MNMGEDKGTDIPITIGDIMTTNVIFLNEDDNLTRIAQGMGRYNLRHLPVVAGDQLVGIVSHRDVLRVAVSSLEAETLDGKVKQQTFDEKTLVRDIMTSDPVTVRPDTPLWDAARIIVTNKFGCLPVVDDNGKLIGIVTEHDLLKTIAQ